VLKGLGKVVDERVEEAVVESLGGSGERRKHHHEKIDEENGAEEQNDFGEEEGENSEFEFDTPERKESNAG